MKNFLLLLPIIFFQNTAVFNKLVGTWQMKTPQGLMYETWQASGNNSFSGKSYMLSGTDTTVFERTMITLEDKEVFYTATVANQNNNKPVRFKLTSTIGNYFVFENKEHDFPQRVIYELVSADSVHARIEGKQNGIAKTEDFYYSRKK